MRNSGKGVSRKGAILDHICRTRNVFKLAKPLISQACCALVNGRGRCYVGAGILECGVYIGEMKKPAILLAGFELVMRSFQRASGASALPDYYFCTEYSVAGVNAYEIASGCHVQVEYCFLCTGVFDYSCFNGFAQHIIDGYC